MNWYVFFLYENQQRLDIDLLRTCDTLEKFNRFCFVVDSIWLRVYCSVYYMSTAYINWFQRTALGQCVMSFIHCISEYVHKSNKRNATLPLCSLIFTSCFSSPDNISPQSHWINVASIFYWGVYSYKFKYYTRI